MSLLFLYSVELPYDIPSIRVLRIFTPQVFTALSKSFREIWNPFFQRSPKTNSLFPAITCEEFYLLSVRAVAERKPRTGRLSANT